MIIIKCDLSIDLVDCPLLNPTEDIMNTTHFNLEVDLTDDYFKWDTYASTTDGLAWILGVDIV